MKYKERILSRTINKAIRTFPALVLTGPRQSGKTTLLKHLFSDSYDYVSLEDPDVRLRAKEDPRAFLAQNKPPLIIDEIQYFPELLSYIKTKIDENRKPGQWIFTGSQNFLLMQNVTESLAGRAAIVSLLPFSYSEYIENADNDINIPKWINSLSENVISKENNSPSDLILRGFYPEIASNKKVDRQLWCNSYIMTYLERDVRSLANIGDLNQFERFLRLCATQTGQIINVSSMARDIGVSVPTAKRWLSYLETGYLVYLLYPYYRNIGKRIVKSPKLYFTDTGLCSYLLGYNDVNALNNGPSFGALFETMIISNFLKKFLNYGEKPSMYYLRTRDGLEVDLVIECEGALHLFEIKSGMTITSKHGASLVKLKNQLKDQIKTMGIISCTEDNFVLSNQVQNYSWKNVLSV